MALQWIEGFDHYGTSINNMLTGGYAQQGAASQSLTTSNPGTGTHAFRFTTHRKGGGGQNTSGVRLVLPSTAGTIGAGFRLRLDSLPSADAKSNVFSLRTSGNSTILLIGIQSDGTVTIRTGGYAGTIIGDSGANKLAAGAYYHIEFKVLHNTTTGAAELRVNGVTWINVTGVDSGAGPSGQVWIGSIGEDAGAVSEQPYANLDDLFIWDTTGSYANDFLGQRVVLFCPPNGDTAEADFTITGSGTGYGAINETPPNDDTSYISAAAATDISEFDLTNAPAAVFAISGVMLFDRSRKTDSGVGNLKKSLISGASVTAGADNGMSETYAKRQDIFHVDPATGAPMTPSAFNAMKIRLERTA